jgi:DNA polymerase-3 subunit gamma/tau
VDNARNHTLLQTKLTELGRPNCQIRFVKADAPVGGRVKLAAVVAPPPSPAPAPPRQSESAKQTPAAPVTKDKAPVAFNKNDFKNDPLIQRALEMFKGQIVEVRA